MFYVLITALNDGICFVNPGLAGIPLSVTFKSSSFDGTPVIRVNSLDMGIALNITEGYSGIVSVFGINWHTVLASGSYVNGIANGVWEMENGEWE